MRKFTTPPQWPDPPTRSWRPPRRWRPPDSWPAAPAGWIFWTDQRGEPVRGPVGRYGGTSRLKVTAIAGIPAALMALVVLNPFNTSDPPTAALAVFAPTETPAPPARRTQKPARLAERAPIPTTPPRYRTCAAVRAAGKAPLRRGDAGYSRALDRDGDGIACERANS
ncbi:excalibur calcium-binding domain-containing protein [Kribbella sp. NPDC026611]|uniref:excalibur calcium-binding domain-containing protein n=1 Tax=Kribbella sp. NPDC026611 TaxID=3154911 RepID=UPI0033E7E843